MIINLKNFNYEVTQGDFIILLGSNGSGKSTLLKQLYKQFQRQCAVLTQNCFDSLFTTLTVYENFLLINKNKEMTRQCFNDYLSEFNANLVHKLNSLVTELSGGEMQALALALSLLNPPTLLLLDEHTSALDPKTSAQIMQVTQKMIQKFKMTCIMTTHNLDIAMQYGNKILMLRDREICQTIDKTNGVFYKEMLMGWY